MRCGETTKAERFPAALRDDPWRANRHGLRRIIFRSCAELDERVERIGWKGEEQSRAPGRAVGCSGAPRFLDQNVSVLVRLQRRGVGKT